MGVNGPLLLAVLLCMGAPPNTATAQRGSDTTVERLEKLEGSVRALERAIDNLTQLLRATLPPAPVSEIGRSTLSLQNSRVRGDEHARIVLVEFADFECPFCGRHAAGTYRELQQKFVNTGKLKYVFRHLPLDQIHPKARRAAEAAECAGEQGKLWEFHDQLFANQKALAESDLHNAASSLMLEMPMFVSCLSDGQMRLRVNAHLDEAKRFALTGTPAFLIGTVQDDGSVQLTHKIVGAQPLHVFEIAFSNVIKVRESDSGLPLH